MKLLQRSAGILMSVSALPSPYGIGCFDRAAYDFVDFLVASGQRYWQILPLGPTGYGDSPYQSFSTFAGNPYLVDLEPLVKAGMLTREACERAGLNQSPHRVDYPHLYRRRLPLLFEACAHSKHTSQPAYQDFCKNNPWLEDYALFMAIKDAHGGGELSTWEGEIRRREPSALERCRRELHSAVEAYKFIQYQFATQWQALKAYANRQGVYIIGDMPIYVSADSADVWANPHLFRLDEHLNPTWVAGCPPDGFSPDGQWWGNPLYDWSAHKKDGFKWWRERMAHSLGMYDVVRIDHFRGFDQYFAIPSEASSAREGCWEDGPGMALFDAMGDILSPKEDGIPCVIAEDLGLMTPTVEALVKASGFPGMRVLQFGFDSRDGASPDNQHLPHNYPPHSVAYTGTHDNQTLVSWYHTITVAERQAVYDYMGGGYPLDTPPISRLIATVMKSRAEMCIIPLQDWLALDDSARMNTPATLGGNWSWRVTKGALTQDLAQEIWQMTKAFERCPKAEKGE